jgi:hypothetical protein
MNPPISPRVRDADSPAPEAAQRRRSSVAVSDIANPIASAPARRRSSVVLQTSDGAFKPGEVPALVGRRRSSVASSGDGALHSGRRNSLIGPTPSKATTENGPPLGHPLGQKRLKVAMLAGILKAAANAREGGQEAQGGECDSGGSNRDKHVLSLYMRSSLSHRYDSNASTFRDIYLASGRYRYAKCTKHPTH